jgi:hypothetical protein
MSRRKVERPNEDDHEVGGRSSDLMKTMTEPEKRSSDLTRMTIEPKEGLAI